MGLERSFTNVSEDAGVVGLCTVVERPNLSCPVRFSFSVNLSIDNQSAGVTVTAFFSCIANMHGDVNTHQLVNPYWQCVILFHR